ncbi:hypothetical protein KAR91_41795 [Candidatus Pacearchaeota archaeon]|nr:hypothetical protein [Candidatus Pacearchaeota archaeon]
MTICPICKEDTVLQQPENLCEQCSRMMTVVIIEVKATGNADGIIAKCEHKISQAIDKKFMLDQVEEIRKRIMERE